MTRVGVFGALGKMGRTVCDAVVAADGLSLVAAIDPAAPGTPICGIVTSDDPKALVEAKVDVAVDFTRPSVVMDDIRFCVDNGIHCVVGTTGLSDGDIDEVRSLTETGSANVFIAPNFSIGAVLAIRFATQAARFLGSCEVIELHHNEKLDAPSGTATSTAMQIADIWRQYGRPVGGEPAPGEEEKLPHVRGGNIGGVGVHSVRLRGLVAHEEILFGGEGQLLTIRHDSIDRSSFMPGVVLAIRSIASRPGLTVGLDALLEL